MPEWRVCSVDGTIPTHSQAHRVIASEANVKRGKEVGGLGCSSRKLFESLSF